MVRGNSVGAPPLNRASDVDEPQVDVVIDGHVYPLAVSGALAVVPEASVAQIQVTGRADEVLHDDVALPMRWVAGNTVGSALVDLVNQVGYHRVSVRRASSRYAFDYQTSSAKATWETVLAMASRVSADAFRYSRQFAYTLPTGERHHVFVPESAYGWLKDRIEEIAHLTREVSAAPGTEIATRVTTSFDARRISIPDTLRLLRERPALLESYAGGPIRVDAKEYAPGAIRVRRSRQRPSRGEHQALAGLLRALVVLCGRLLASVPDALAAQVQQWLHALGELRTLPIIRDHDRLGLPADLSPVASALERRDQRYARLRVLRAEAAQRFAASALATDGPRIHLQNIAEIFQTFAAFTVGYAAGLRPCDPTGDLRARDKAKRSMSSDRYDLYYDVHPPADVMRSWRDATSRPADERPDIVLYDRATSQAAVFDAKFKIDRDGARATGEDLAEMQSYMQSFGLDRGGIIHPGPTPNLIVIGGQQNCLVDLAVSPEDPALYDQVREAVALLTQGASEA